MRLADQIYNIRYRVDVENCDLPPEIPEALEDREHALHRAVAEFPVSDLHISVTRHARSGDYRVKATLLLPNAALATGETDQSPGLAFHRCLRKLVRRVERHKEDLEGGPERAKSTAGTYQDVTPPREPDTEALDTSMKSGDYATFRQALYPYENPLAKRAGRWIERYPEIDEQMGRRWTIADILEEIYLNAFERFDERPQDRPLSEWLESLIDPSVRSLIDHPDEETDNISFAKSWREAATNPSGSSEPRET